LLCYKPAPAPEIQGADEGQFHSPKIVFAAVGNVLVENRRGAYVERSRIASEAARAGVACSL